MLFSTLVPTLAHLVVAVFSMMALPFFALIDAPLSRWINEPDTTTSMAAPLVLGLAVTVSVALPVMLFYILYVGAVVLWHHLAEGYLGLFKALARMVRES